MRYQKTLMACILCLLLTGSLSASATVLTSAIQGGVIANSEVTTNLGVCSPCTITHTLIGGTADGDIAYSWDMPESGFSMSGVFPTGVQIHPTNSYTTFDTVVSASGSVTLTNIPTGTVTSGVAGYWRESPGAALELLNSLLDTIGKATDLKSDLKGSPTKIRYTSHVERTGLNEYSYTNMVENLTAYDIDFEWMAAGMSGTVAANSVLSGPTIIGGQAMQKRGTASARVTLDSLYGGTSTNNYQIIANVLAPVPLPPAIWLMGAALTGLFGIGRRRSLASTNGVL